MDIEEKNGMGKKEFSDAVMRSKVISRGRRGISIACIRIFYESMIGGGKKGEDAHAYIT